MLCNKIQKFTNQKGWKSQTHIACHSHRAHQFVVQRYGVPFLRENVAIALCFQWGIDLLRKHEVTPSGESSSRSPMKESFESSTASPLSSNSYPNSTPLDRSREEFRRKPIVEEPKRNVTGYQLFARWKRAQNEHKTSSKAISAAWAQLTDVEKDEWIKQSDAAKKEYHRQKELFMDYCQEARRLV